MSNSPEPSDLHELMGAALRRLGALVQCAPTDRATLAANPELFERMALHLVLATTAASNLSAELVALHALTPEPGLAGLLVAAGRQVGLHESHLSTLRSAALSRNRILFDYDDVTPEELFQACLGVPPSLTELLRSTTL